MAMKTKMKTKMTRQNPFMGELQMREGFWHSTYEPKLPKPRPDPTWSISDRQIFVEKLIAFEDSILVPYLDACIKSNQNYVAAQEQRDRDRIDNPELKHSTVTYEFPVEPRVASYRGSSTCRLCGQSNGSREFHVAGWIWPVGYRHYIEMHQVRPSLAFEEFVTKSKFSPVSEGIVKDSLLNIGNRVGSGKSMAANFDFSEDFDLRLARGVKAIVDSATAWEGFSVADLKVGYLAMFPPDEEYVVLHADSTTDMEALLHQFVEAAGGDPIGTRLIDPRLVRQAHTYLQTPTDVEPNVSSTGVEPKLLKEIVATLDDARSQLNAEYIKALKAENVKGWDAARKEFGIILPWKLSSSNKEAMDAMPPIKEDFIRGWNECLDTIAWINKVGTVPKSTE
jgi:hypothetical protein